MKTARRVVLAIAALLAFAQIPAGAQFQGVFQGPAPGGPPPQGATGAPPFGPGPGRLGGPPRDPRAPLVTGTAIIRGRILASDTGRPLRRARIQVNAPELAGDERVTSTNADGRY